ncbi:MAG: hypothetical protein KBF59_08495, partial [Ignavibacterium sp.]|nr:hypothetical protein [Ignavibacterium sp.]
MYRVKLVVFYISILFIPSITAQSNIRFDHLTVQDGLSQSAVTVIFQDKQGFMWFGTQDGLNRYDGYNFKVFKNIPSDSTSLTDNFIFSIYEDKTGSLIIETQTGNFNKYNPITESFSLIKKDDFDLVNIKGSSLGAFCVESKGNQWRGGLSKPIGLNRIDSKNGKEITFKHNPSDPTSLINDKVYSIYRDKKGNLWVGTFDGLDKLDEKTGKFSHYRNDPQNSNSLPDNWVWPIYEDSHGNLWIGTVRGGVSKFNPATNTFANFNNDPDDPTSINDNFIFSIYEDRSG